LAAGGETGRDAAVVRGPSLSFQVAISSSPIYPMDFARRRNDRLGEAGREGAHVFHESEGERRGILLALKLGESVFRHPEKGVKSRRAVLARCDNRREISGRPGHLAR
jgi:hypothetical protein